MASGVLGDEKQMEVKLQTMQHQVIERIVTESPCVIIGRRADLPAAEGAVKLIVDYIDLCQKAR